MLCLGILVADALARPVDAVPWGSLGLVDEVVLRGGGCALNTASALARLGTPSSVAGKVGADPFGDFLLRLLDERGVDRRGVIRDPSVPTSASVVLVSSGGERTFLHTPGANARVSVATRSTSRCSTRPHVSTSPARSFSRSSTASRSRSCSPKRSGVVS